MLDQAFDALKTYEWGVDPKVLKPIQEAITSTHGDAAARKDLETRLSAVLASDVPRAAKDAVCRALRQVGTAASVPTTAALLPDQELCHMACYALEDNPAPEAGQALLGALPKLEGKAKVQVIATLGVRREAAAVAPLQALLSDSDPATAHAAARALGAIGSPAAAKVLVASKPSATTKDAIADASLKCAEKLLAAGDKPTAKMTYEKILASAPSAPVMKAVTLGIKACQAG
jgi:HEAT repeat protein